MRHRNRRRTSRQEVGIKPARPRRNSHVLFGLLVIVLSAVVATFLLANDMYHLRSLARRYGLDRLFAEPSGTEAPVALKGRRLEPVPVEIPRYFFTDFIEPAAGAFVREIRVRGPALCKELNRAGLKNPGWQPSEYDRRTSECLSETRFAAAGTDTDGGEASLFFIAKGTPQGEVRSVRMKLVAPAGMPGETAQAWLVEALSKIIDRTTWSDFAPAADAARQLADYSAVHFGISVEFSRDFVITNGYNFILAPDGRNPLVRRTRAYFSPDGWLPLKTGEPRLPAALIRHWRMAEAGTGKTARATASTP